MNPPGHAPTGTRRPAARAVVLFVVGIALIGAAVALGLRASAGGPSQPALLEALRTARTQPWPLILAAFALPLLNWLFVSVGFWVLTTAYGPPDRRVRLPEMAALTGSAWLLNYLPFKAGLIGRVAYHKTVNGVGIADSVRVLAISIACAAVATLVLIVAAVVIKPDWPPTLMVGVLLAPAVAGTAAAAALKKLPGELWRLAACLTIRYLDVLVWTARYAVVFALIGRPLTPGQAAAVAGCSQATLVVPLTGNALGLREWVVGWAASSLPSWFGSAVPGELATGLAADLVNRLAEIMVSIVVGTTCSAAVARRLAAWNASHPSPSPDHDPTPA